MYDGSDAVRVRNLSNVYVAKYRNAHGAEGPTFVKSH